MHIGGRRISKNRQRFSQVDITATCRLYLAHGKRKGLYRSASLYNCSGDMISETMIDRGDAFIASLDLRVSEILDRCTRCARCVEVCPTAGPAGIDTREPETIVGDVLDILRGGGDAASQGARWAQTCTGSGRCLSACDDGVNPRFMLAMTRLTLNAAKADDERRAAGQKGFHTMSEGVKVLSRLQLPAELIARITRSAHAATEGSTPDVVLYLGCNVMKTPHIALLCMDVLDRIGARYSVSGGPANCCGVIQFRAGDLKTAA